MKGIFYLIVLNRVFGAGIAANEGKTSLFILHYLSPFFPAFFSRPPADKNPSPSRQNLPDKLK